MQKSKLFLLFFISFCGTACSVPGAGGEGGLFHPSKAHDASQLRNPQAIPLSLSDPLLKTCVFKPETRIAHFPMWHFPPDGKYKADLREKVAKSQFQLLQTILMYYPNIAVFDERVTFNHLNPKNLRLLRNNGKQNAVYTRVDGASFDLQERFNTAQTLFHANIPSHYEHLTEQQKEYLFQTGAALTVYFLGYVPQLHKVIEYEDLTTVTDFIKNSGGGERFFKASGNGGNNADRKYYIYDFREEKLFQQVTEFFNINPGFSGMALISYGANHDFSDDFSGYFFEAGTSCLAWSDAPEGPVFSAFASLIPGRGGRLNPP